MRPRSRTLATRSSSSCKQAGVDQGYLMAYTWYLAYTYSYLATQ